MSASGGGCTDGCFPSVSIATVDGLTKYNSNCGDGGTGCSRATFLSPIDGEDRDFHTASLKTASDELNTILNRESANPPGGGLFLRIVCVPGGVMLVWSTHGPTPAGAITPDSPLQDRKVAYGLAHHDYEAS